MGGEIGPLRLVPLHRPRPLRDPLRDGGLGCLRTRAIAPAHSYFASGLKKLCAYAPEFSRFIQGL